MSFLRKVALITGGARGFGKGFGQEVLKNGGKVSVVDLLPDEGIATTEQLNKEFGPGSATFIKCDVANQEELSNAFKETKNYFGQIDMVVNNAGIAGIAGLDNPNWKRIIDIDLTAVAHGNILAKQYLSKKNGGRGGVVVNVASTAGLTGVPSEPIYSAAKHGVVGLSRSVVPVFEELGIKVGCICPSFAKTKLVTDILDKADEDPVAGLFKQQLDQLGCIEISEVVKAFRLIVESENTGLVLTVTPANGIEIKFPKNMKGKVNV